MSSAGAAPRAAVSVSNARAEASRRNGARSRGPKTPAGKARSAQNALKHGLRAQKYLVLPQEDAAEFAALHAALVEELAPEGVLQSILVGRIALAAWRLERADRLETEVLEFRSYEGANAGLALIRDGNGTRAFETLLRYRGAAMAEFWRALKTLKALQAEQAADATVQPHPEQSATRPALAHGPQPNQPESAAARPLAYALPEPGTPDRTLPEPAAPWVPNEPETLRGRTAAPAQPAGAPNEPEPRQHAASAPAKPILAPNEPEPHRARRPDHGTTTPSPTPGPTAMRPMDSEGRMDRLNKCLAHS